MQTKANRAKRATATPARSQKKKSIPLHERAALSPTEFAMLFGKHPTWAYRLIYAGKIKVFSPAGGDMLIAHSEIQRIQSAQAVYSGKTAQ